MLLGVLGERFFRSFSNKAVEKYEKLVEIPENCCKVCCRTSLKISFQYIHLNYFPDAVSEEQGDRFHQDIVLKQTGIIFETYIYLLSFDQR